MDPHLVEAAHSLHFFVLGHSEKCFVKIPKLPFLRLIDLNSLDIDKYQKNSWAENRIFFSEIHDTAPDYLGFGTWKWNQKFWWVYRLQNMHHLIPSLSPSIVYTPLHNKEALRTDDELTKYFYWFPTDLTYEVRDYVRKLMEWQHEMNWFKVMCNSFICHKSVYLDFLKVYRPAVEHFYHKYGEDVPLADDKDVDKGRIPGYLFEIITMWYFAYRKDITVKTLGK